MMVTADEYELPICVEESAEELGRKMGVSKSTIASVECRGRKYGQKGTKGRKATYRVYKVKEDDEGAEGDVSAVDDGDGR